MLSKAHHDPFEHDPAADETILVFLLLQASARALRHDRGVWGLGNG